MNTEVSAKISSLIVRHCDEIVRPRISSGIVKAKMESPIEEILLAAMILRSTERKFPQINVHTPHTFEEALEAGRFALWGSVSIFPQVQISPYRVDFLVLCPVTRTEKPYLEALVVECDGHDFHEKNKEQAAADKSRDRYFLRGGIPTMRFTGSEIWADAFSCVDEIQSYFSNKLDSFENLQKFVLEEAGAAVDAEDVQLNGDVRSNGHAVPFDQEVGECSKS